MSLADLHFCDDCGQDIPEGVTCYAVLTGRTDDELRVPIVRIVCAACHTESGK